MSFSPLELERYRKLLEDLRAELEKEINQEHGEANIVKLEGTMGRISRGDAMQVQQIALNVKRQREERLTRVRTAIERIERKEFGTCVRCSNPISPGRLEAFPDSLLCVRCADTPRR